MSNKNGYSDGGVGGALSAGSMIPRFKNTVIATSPKLVVTHTNVPGEALSLSYQTINHNFDRNQDEIVKLNFSLTFEEIENLSKFVQNAKKEHAALKAAEKKDAIKRAQADLDAAKGHVKWSERNLKAVKNAR